MILHVGLAALIAFIFYLLIEMRLSFEFILVPFFCLQNKRCLSSEAVHRQ